jgi:hypothetical protein
VYLSSVPPDHQLTAAQIVILRQTMNKIRETVHRIASEHRDLHSTVSKVGKAIDRVSFILILSVWSYMVYSVHTKTTADKTIHNRIHFGSHLPA